jgi:hypothetical protein
MRGGGRGRHGIARTIQSPPPPTPSAQAHYDKQLEAAYQDRKRRKHTAAATTGAGAGAGTGASAGGSAAAADGRMDSARSSTALLAPGEAVPIMALPAFVGGPGGGSGGL